MLPLQGVRVLDFSMFLAGPYCSMVLGDLGADVIKVEGFPDGDSARNFEPKINDESYCFAALNRNKKSLAVDLKHPAGQQIVRRLAQQADIVLENFRPGAMARLGLDHAALQPLNPGLVYTSISGFGQTGPYREQGGFDIIAQGMSGIMMMTGEPGGRPAKVGIALHDIAAGVTALYGTLGAYIGRLRTGTGQYLETSLLEAGLAWSVWEFGAFFGNGELPLANGTRHRRAAPYQAFRTQDGHVTVGAGTEKLWQLFCTQVCASPQWLGDPRFATSAARLENVDALEREIEAVLTTQTTAHWIARLNAAQVPGGPVYGYADVMDDAQVKARRMVVDIDHPVIGPMKMLGLPLKASGDLTAIRQPAPWLGQHTEELVRQAGFDAAEVAGLFENGVIFNGRR